MELCGAQTRHESQNDPTRPLIKQITSNDTKKYAGLLAYSQRLLESHEQKETKQFLYKKLYLR